MAAILEAFANETSGVRIAAVISDTADAAGLVVASAAGVPTEVVPLSDFGTRADWNVALGDTIARHTPDLVMLAGFMKILAPETVERFFPRIINTHPALLPSFPGAHGVRDALAYGVKSTGCTVHLVDAGVDTGPIVAQAVVQVEDGDSEATLHERIKVVERRLVVETISDMLKGGWVVDGRRVTLGAKKETGR